MVLGLKNLTCPYTSNLKWKLSHFLPFRLGSWHQPSASTEPCLLWGFQGVFGRLREIYTNSFFSVNVCGVLTRRVGPCWLLILSTWTWIISPYFVYLPKISPNREWTGPQIYDKPGSSAPCMSFTGIPPCKVEVCTDSQRFDMAQKCLKYVPTCIYVIYVDQAMMYTRAGNRVHVTCRWIQNRNGRKGLATIGFRSSQFPHPTRWSSNPWESSWALGIPPVDHGSIPTSSTAQGGGGSFKNRKPIGEVGCCESGMAKRSHWWIERCLISLTLSLSFSDYLPTYLPIYLSIYRSIYRSISLFLFHLSICLAVYLSICLSIYLSVCLSICLPVYLWCSVIQSNVV